jgi:hypothetical protein
MATLAPGAQDTLIKELGVYVFIIAMVNNKPTVLELHRNR